MNSNVEYGLKEAMRFNKSLYFMNLNYF